MIKSIPFFRSPWQTPSSAAQLTVDLMRVLESGHYILGPQAREFESALSERLCNHQVVALNSGTDALVLALQVLNLQPGDEVILPTYTFFACFEAVLRVGATPILADSADDDFLCGEAQIRPHLSPRTRAVIGVPLFGDASGIPAIAQLCRDGGITLIEDAAQALGAKAFDIQRGWLAAGTMGDISTLSFYPTKTLGAAGDAGALVSSNGYFADQARALRNHGLTSTLHTGIGLNSRMDEIQATVLLQGLNRLDDWLTQRQAIAQCYLQGLANIPGITLPRHNDGHAWNYFVLRCDRRDELQARLKERGVDTRIYYQRAIHEQPAYRERFNRPQSTNAQVHAQQALAIPLFPGLTTAETQWVIEAIRAACHDSEEVSVCTTETIRSR